MKLTKTKLNPKNLFKSKTHTKVSRSSSSSFTSNTTSSNSPDSTHHIKSKPTGITTPTSVLPTQPHTTSTSYSYEPFPCSTDEHHELIQAFQIIDTDNDGRISRSELETLLTRIGISSDELNLMIDELDTDHDGTISLEEFAVISSAFGPPKCDDELRGAFEVFDVDHDGLITADELFEVFKLIGDGGCTLDECRRMISSVDRNGDGFVCFEDFARMMELQR